MLLMFTPLSVWLKTILLVIFSFIIIIIIISINCNIFSHFSISALSVMEKNSISLQEIVVSIFSL